MKTTTSLLLIIVSLAIAFLFSYPSYKENSILRENLTVLKENLSQIIEVKSTQNSLAQKYKGIDQESLSLLKKIVPESFDSVRFIGVLNQVAMSNSMFLSQINIEDSNKSSASLGRADVLGENIQPQGISADISKPKTPSSLYSTKNLSFTLNGDYRNFIKTILDLEKSVQIVDIKNLTVSTEGSGNSGKTKSSSGLTFEVKISTYSIK